MKLHTLIHTLKTELPTNIMSLEHHVDEVKWGGTHLPLTVPKGRLGSWPGLCKSKAQHSSLPFVWSWGSGRPGILIILKVFSPCSLMPSSGIQTSMFDTTVQINRLFVTPLSYEAKGKMTVLFLLRECGQSRSQFHSWWRIHLVD